MFNAPLSSSASPGPCPIVLRFAEMRPEELSKFTMHAQRSGGDLQHVDPQRDGLNEHLIGQEDWVESALAEVDWMRHANFAEELGALKARKRRKDMDARILQGLKAPWRESKGGPLREVILTANKEWFETTTELGELFSEDEQAEREALFKAHAVNWLTSRFGDAVIHAHADHDETTCHIHAVLMPRHEKTSTRRGLQRSLQPSAYPLLKDYEKAQDDAGAFFEEIGLTRGERSAAARREALSKNAEARRVARETGKAADLVQVPDLREHVPTPVWWAQEINRLRLEADELARGKEKLSQDKEVVKVAREDAQNAQAVAKERERQAETRERDADAVQAMAEAVGSGQIDFTERDGVAVPVLKPATTQEEAAVARRIKRSGPRAAGFLEVLRKTYTKLSARTEDRAVTKLLTEFTAVRRAATAFQSLKSKILRSLSASARDEVLQDIDRAERAGEIAGNKLKASKNTLVGKKRNEERQ